MPVDKDQFLLEIYKDQIAQGRHLETQRLEVTKFILVAAAALLALAGNLKFSIHCIPLCLGVMWLGKFGERIAVTFVERFEGHMGRARAARKALGGILLDVSIEKMLDDNPVVKTGRLRDMWLKINRSLIIVGAIALAWNLAAVGARLALETGSCSHRLVEQFAFADAEQKH